MELWEKSNRSLHSYIDERSPDPSISAKARLLEAATDASSMRPLVWVIPSAAVAAAAVIAVVLIGAPPADDVAEDTNPLPSVVSYDYRQVYPEGPESKRSVAAGAWIKGAAGGHVIRVQHSLLGMDRTTEIGVTASDSEENRFLLKTGVVAVELPLVKHRERLLVKAGSLSITVKGTIFWVEVDGEDQVEVGVVRGEVSVTAESGQAWDVKAGTRLVVQGDNHSETTEVSDTEKRRARLLLYPYLTSENSGMVVDEPVEPGDGPDADVLDDKIGNPNRSIKDDLALTNIEQWILRTQYTKARFALQRRLKIDPTDRAALDLLATCYRKQGDYTRAAEVYGKLTSMGNAAAQNRARFKLSVIYQENIGDHLAAVSTLRAYLAAPPMARPNTLEARLRLARSLRRIGRIAEYRQTLETVVSAHPGTQGAEKAKQLLAETP